MKASDLKYFQELLEAKKAQIEKNLKESAKEIEELNDQELKDEGDFASVSADNMVENVVSEQQMAELREINIALSKIKNGGYGICETCEEPIGIQRLRVFPHARNCIVCQEMLEKKKH